MWSADLFFDIGLLISGIAATVLVILKRNSFDRWTSLLTCSSWILKGIRVIGYDLYLVVFKNAMSSGQLNDVFLLMKNAQLVLTSIDILVNLLLLVALVRLALLGLYRRWYKKAIKLLVK